MKKYWIITFGCQMNISDSERIASVLEKAKYKKAPQIEGADLIAVNMCSVRQSAVNRVYGLVPKLKELKTKNRKLKTILTGCVLSQDRKKLAQQFDLILDIRDLPIWPKLLKTSSRPHLSGINSYLTIKPKYTTKFSAYVPIMTGCNKFCSYCVVPYTRGREISRPTEEILDEIKTLVKKGYKEIWLLGQNVNSYKFTIQISESKSQNPKTKTINFAELLKMVQSIPGNFWIRFTSPHPRDFSGQLIETMAKCKKVCPYLNLPVQSGDDEILKRMGRGYTVKEYKNLIKKIRRAFKKYRKGLEKEIALSTDIIVGFPGETKKQFENTAKLFKEIKFDMAYISCYSRRPGTSAFKLKDNISSQEKKKREKILTDILRQTALEKNRKYIGKTVKVLVEKQHQEYLIGKSPHYKTVKFKGKNKLIGEFVKVKITDALAWGLKGKIIGQKIND